LVNRSKLIESDGNNSPNEARYSANLTKFCLPVDEVKEIVQLPGFLKRKFGDREDIEIDRKVLEQLKAFVTEVALLYGFNPFHNFEHACHVTMSVGKLMS
jgi:hypothetical protein